MARHRKPVAEPTYEPTYVVMIDHRFGRQWVHVNHDEGQWRRFRNKQSAHGHARDAGGRLYCVEENGNMTLLEEFK